MLAKFYFIIFLFFFNFNAFSETKNNIFISGNKRISQESIKNTFYSVVKKKYSAGELNEIQKKIFETNFFEKVDVSLKDNNLYITVIENPIINFFIISGITNSQREKLIYDEISLKQNNIFSQSILKADIEKIKTIYENSGYYNVNVETKMSVLDNNLVNIALDVTKGKKYDIDSITFTGKKFFSNSILAEVISSSKQGWWKFFSNSATANLKRIDYDEFLLKNFYLDSGFFDVQILSSDILLDEKNNKASLNFAIESGDRYYFDKFNIIDKNFILNQKQQENISLIVSKHFKNYYSRKVLRRVSRDINNFLNTNKIEFASLNTSTLKADNKISVDFIFNKAPRKFINNITINGNSITEETVVRRALSFAEGDSFTPFKLSESKRSINNLGIFKKVDINAFNTETNNKELIDINILVEEMPTGSVSAGVGIGSDQSSIMTGISEANLFGKGIGANIGANLGTDKINGSLSIEVPDFNNTDNSLLVDLFAISTDYKNAGYESSKFGSNLSTKFEVFDNIFFKTGVGFDRDDINANSTASALYKSREGQYTTFKSFYFLENDTRDNRFQATDGKRIIFGQTLAIPGSDVEYLENNFSASYYHQYKDDFVLNLKGSLNSINALDNKDVKLSDRQFSTSKNLRGFQNRGVGPIDGTEHIGGNYSAFSTVSSTFPSGLPEKWNAKTLAFVDFGSVWGVDYNSSLNDNEIRSSFGIALDWLSPLGPINFTVAETINSVSTDKKESFTFNLGSAF